MTKPIFDAETSQSMLSNSKCAEDRQVSLTDDNAHVALSANSNSSRRLRFPLGQVVATPGATALLDLFDINVFSLLLRHAHGDWGELDPADKLANDEAANAGHRLLSSYQITHNETSQPANGRIHPSTIWIITEADRSVTTVLLPEEY